MSEHERIEDVARAVAARDDGVAPPPERPPQRYVRRAPKPRPEALPPTPIEEAGISLEPDPPAPDANGVRIYTAQDEVPADESDPLKRDGVTYESIEPEEGMQFPDQSGALRRPPANLTDICREYRIGPGDVDCYIRVERKEPKVWQGVAAVGYLGCIREPIAEGDFRDLVGGGKYELVVYGPDPRGVVSPFSGTVEIKPLTKPIVVHHPGRPRFMDFDRYFGRREEAEDERNDVMIGYEGRRVGLGRGDATSADAKIHADSLNFARSELDAKRVENEKLRAEVNRDPATPAVVKAIENSARAGVEAVEKTSTASMAMLERQLQDRDKQIDELRRELRDLATHARTQPPSDKSAWDAFASLSSAALQSRGSDPAAAAELARQHAAEMTRQHDAHQREMDRVLGAHSRELETLRSRSEQMLTTKDAELDRMRSQYEQRERDIRTEFERREASVRDESRRREDDLDKRQRERLETLVDGHKRELESLKRQEELIRETHKTTYETRLAAADERIRTAKEEAERARKEAEDKDDLAGQLEKLSTQAELMGYSKGSENEPQTWQERLVDVLGQGIQNLPGVFDSASRTFAARQEAIQASVQAMRLAREQQSPRVLPGQQQQRPGAPPPGARPPGPPPAARRFWATEDGVPFQSAARPTEAEVRPEQRPEPVGGAAAPQAPPPASAAAAPPPMPPPPRAAPPGPVVIPPAMLLQIRTMLEDNYNQGTLPADFAQAMYQEIGPDQLGQLIRSMSPEILLNALSDDPAGAASVLLTREGRQWFKSVWSIGLSLVEAEPRRA
jgi:Skp family chaperone for outer membrane proteins